MGLALIGRVCAPLPYALSRRLFAVGLGATYAIAFASFGVQISALIGEKGILPATEYLKTIHDALGASAYWQSPTLFWIASSSSALKIACALGGASAIALILGFAPRLALFIAWVLYLSLVSVGGIFMGYQWDNLLLEAGLVALPFLPRGLRLAGASPAPTGGSVILLWFLLFRLMFMSGVVKLASGDPTWRNLTALQFHYWTQPLPTWMAYWIGHLPNWFHRLSTVSTLTVELLVPFLIFGGRRARRLGFVCFVGLQMLIAATGNYGFFNLLAVVLCLPLLDDATLGRLVKAAPIASGTDSRFRKLLHVVIVCAFALISFAETTVRLFRVELADGFISRALEWVAPLRSFNTYGLFAVMTTSRPEIIVEGTNDGEHWIPYEFEWKPGAVDRRPRFVAPHQPRLDWQMWFAALGTCRRNPWFLRFQQRLLEGSPEVVGLLRNNPFKDGPPRQLRSSTYEYHLSSIEQARAGTWWERRPLGPYCPKLELKDGRLQLAD